MATTQLGFSFNSSQFLPEIFRSMFPGSQITADYSLRQQKLSDVISHGTGYYFTNELIKDVGKAHESSLLFDETTIAGVRKQLDIFFDIGQKLKIGSSSMLVFGLISIGSCPLHVIHGSFRKGIKSAVWFIDEALNDIWF
ncbi:unnamed protein product [Rotaria sordida]|nr:unnamed protein product [Rotaria sordida]CAF3722659.1 unnamed protein product [Rotaria sordida]